LQVALATFFPVIIGFFAMRATMVVGGIFGVNMALFVLVGCCAVLLASASWLNQVLFVGAKTILPFRAAIVATLTIWVWQKLAIISLVPRSGLAYGFFLKPEGAKAQFWSLTCPFWVGFTCLSVCWIAALFIGWRGGARLSLACIVPWWLVTLVVFALPSMYLDAQGNASLFI